MRVKITLAYDGSRYLGFQVQNTTTQTVAQKLYDAFESLHIKSKITSSGRTDKNVHATNQVIHIDLPEFWTDCEKLLELLNHKLPLTIRIKSVKKVSTEFHARFSPKKRTYRYILTTTPINAFLSQYVTYTDQINISHIQQGLNLFLGEHDFRYFQKSGGGNGTTTREIYHAKIYKYQNYFIITIKANGFLRSQIRMIIFALLALNTNKITLSELQEQIELKKQYLTGLSPAAGLYLTHIHY